MNFSIVIKLRKYEFKFKDNSKKGYQTRIVYSKLLYNGAVIWYIK